MKDTKRFLKLLTVFIMFFGVVCFSNANAYEEYESNELQSGWNRYDDTNNNIEYLPGCGSGVSKNLDKQAYNNSETYVAYDKSTVKFKINGSRFRIIGSYFTVKDIYSCWDVYVDGVKVNTFTGSRKKQTTNKVEGGYQKILYEYSIRNYGKHEIAITCRQVNKNIDDGWLAVDAIDVYGTLGDGDSTGKKLDSILKVEEPVIGKIYTGTLPISGYALNQSGVKEVNTYIDDYFSKNCTIGISRTDVGNKYSQYTEAYNSGFSTNYNVGDFTLGTHTMKIQSVGRDGTKKEVILYLYVYNNKVEILEEKVQTVNFYRYCKKNSSVHFYTTNYNELGEGASGYVLESRMCSVYPKQVNGTVPLYRYCKDGTDEHTYTTNYSKYGNGKGTNYTYEGVQCYVYKTQVSGTRPLYRYVRNDGVTFLTTDYNELKSGALNYKYDGIECYVL